MGFQVDIKGMDSVFSRLDRLQNDIAQGIDDELDASAEDIAGNARTDCPVGSVKGESGGLRESISVVRDVFLQRQIVADKFYAPYVEFGTGEFAAAYLAGQPKELQDYAMQFYVNGKGRMPAAPFLFPNLVAQQPVLIERIKNVIKNA